MDMIKGFLFECSDGLVRLELDAFIHREFNLRNLEIITYGEQVYKLRVVIKRPADIKPTVMLRSEYLRRLTRINDLFEMVDMGDYLHQNRYTLAADGCHVID